MFFSDLLKNEQEKGRFEKTCHDLATFVSDCVKPLINAFDVGLKNAEKANYQLTVYLLARHAIECLDAVSVLVSKGCSNPCQPLLRSALEAKLSVLYILKNDTKRRALAYQVGHYHRRLSLYRKMDPSTQAGQEFAKFLDGDSLAASIIGDVGNQDFKGMAANVEWFLSQAEFKPIEDEWVKLKKAKKSEPEWYSLFGGPSNMRALAKEVGQPGMYEFLYRYWSNEIHSGSAFNATGTLNGQQMMRPIRHPEELQQAVNLAANLSLLLARRLLEVYAPAELDQFRIEYQEKLQTRSRALRQKSVIIAPWRDDAGF